MKTEETLEALPPEDDNSVTLDTPIIRGKILIDSITLRKPQAGELRGVHLVELLNMDVATLIKILPRISNPSITAPEAAGMDPADLLACGSKISGFLLQKSVKADASLVA
ncbi:MULTISPECIES: phage tail assembly protein [unclassified Pseudomonas]|uniref:phage tail assembly protein n=1 Tax=unclassified Pseudomonas TaxID=196821 RepID=UPI00087618F0|nr:MULTISPECIES: phage tail assembly protein [unclassified Pseudomonas]SCZ38011.1 Phage tail assembly chaperone protein, E, or 41 or 14 [Pseudomonas sp. NFACC44-2]SDA88530.1 Phage tail assembly chaperone protein, E, or 41 or 14 [Pseudomonas sp. NFACC51]SFI02177.1 Phage tail assembly chaperone protein, E, or 41 or 14 [Pseudomonas sp. NFACC54]SFT24245.1 Phage tail assembly chaperone protein, E, or 41 or 14 [Pseudomonas sp. NFACC48-1]